MFSGAGEISTLSVPLKLNHKNLSKNMKNDQCTINEKLKQYVRLNSNTAEKGTGFELHEKERIDTERYRGSSLHTSNNS